MTGLPVDIFKSEPLPSEDQRLVDLYVKYRKSVDDLAYSEEFEKLYEEAKNGGDTRTKGQVIAGF